MMAEVSTFLLYLGPATMIVLALLSISTNWPQRPFIATSVFVLAAAGLWSQIDLIIRDQNANDRLAQAMDQAADDRVGSERRLQFQLGQARDLLAGTRSDLRSARDVIEQQRAIADQLVLQNEQLLTALNDVQAAQVAASVQIVEDAERLRQCLDELADMISRVGRVVGAQGGALRRDSLTLGALLVSPRCNP